MSLLKEREDFKKKALSLPVIEKRKNDSNIDNSSRKKIKPSSTNVNNSLKLDMRSCKSMSGSSQYRFGVLTKIVKYMKNRHQEGDSHVLSIDEILDETNQLDVGIKCKQWLENEALPNNPKIETTDDKKFVFKPVYKIRDRKALLRLLKQHDLKGIGGILLEDIQESLPNHEKALRILQNQNELIYIKRPIDKKQVVFYNDRTANLTIDEEFQKLWRSVAVDAMDDEKIEEYLDKQGIRSMQNHGIKKPIAPLKRRKPQRKTARKIRDNEHFADVLETYENGIPAPSNNNSQGIRINIT